MLDVGFGELLVILIVAVVVIGPKDLPLAMRTAGRWIGKVRRVSAHFRSGIDAMVREAELEDMEKKWKAQNEEIMRRSAALTAESAAAGEATAAVMTGPPPPAEEPGAEPPPAATPAATGTESETAAAPDSPVPAPAAPLPPPPPPTSLAKAPREPLAVVRIGGDAATVMPDPPREPMLPARPHTGEDDV
jgi:sec-independent protein translocase protein TatB